jgi:hypothetical protein
VYRRVAPGADDSVRSGPALGRRSSAVRRATEGIRTAGGFSEPEEWRFTWEQRYSREEWLDQLSTQSNHSLLPASTGTELLAGLGAVIDELGGALTTYYTTIVATAVRAAAH